MRAGILSSAILLALVPCRLHAGAPEPDAQVQAVVVGASGRGSEATFDPRIPAKFRRQLQCCHLAYTKYDLVGIHRKLTRFGIDVRLPLPDNEALSIIATPNDSRSHPLRIGVRVLDARQKVIQKIQVRVPYAKTFLIHRPRGPAAVIMGVSAHKPPTK